MTRIPIFLLALCCTAVSGQYDSVRVVTSTRIISLADVPSADVFDNSILQQPASFIGGPEALAAYMTNSLTYPPEARDAGIQGTVRVRFIVEPDGMVNEVEVKEGVDPALDREAMRVVLAMPNWSPALVHEKPVRASVLQPVKFALQ